MTFSSQTSRFGMFFIVSNFQFYLGALSPKQKNNLLIIN